MNRCQKKFCGGAMAAAVLIGCGGAGGCGKAVQELAKSIAAMTDPRDSLYSQMLDCEERYCDILETTTDLESIQKAEPQMLAEAKRYRELAKQFLALEGLTTEKLKGVLERSKDRQTAVNARVNEQTQRLIGDGKNREISMAIPHLLWFGIKINFFGEAAEIASGQKQPRGATGLAANPPPNGPPPPPPRSTDEIVQEKMDAAKARMEESRARMEQRMEESRARMEAMRAKMKRPAREREGRVPPALEERARP
jgi:hypothetical protein